MKELPAERSGLPRLRHRNWRIAALAGAAALVALAIGVPLHTLAFFGVLALCPLLMMGMHGGSRHEHQDHTATSKSGWSHERGDG